MNNFQGWKKRPSFVFGPIRRYPRNLLNQFRQVEPHRLPDDLGFHIEVSMDQAIPHVDNVRPRNDWLGCSQLAKSCSPLRL